MNANTTAQWCRHPLSSLVLDAWRNQKLGQAYAVSVSEDHPCCDPGRASFIFCCRDQSCHGWVEWHPVYYRRVGTTGRGMLALLVGTRAGPGGGLGGGGAQEGLGSAGSSMPESGVQCTNAGPRVQTRVQIAPTSPKGAPEDPRGNTGAPGELQSKKKKFQALLPDRQFRTKPGWRLHSTRRLIVALPLAATVAGRLCIASLPLPSPASLPACQLPTTILKRAPPPVFRSTADSPLFLLCTLSLGLGLEIRALHQHDWTVLFLRAGLATLLDLPEPVRVPGCC